MDHHPQLDAQMSQSKEGRRVREAFRGRKPIGRDVEPDKSLHQPREDGTAADKRSAVGICMLFVRLALATSLSILGVRKRLC